MNRRRLLTIGAAVLLTLIGTVILVAYVNAAEQRAQQGEQLTTVLVPTERIEANAAARDLADRVTTDEVPRDLRPEGAVTDLAELGDRVTTTDLLPGEPLREERFGAPGQARAGREDIPEGFQVVSLSLEPQRALGGRIDPGLEVGVLLSVDQAEVPDPDAPGETNLEDQATGMVLNHVLVTDVSGGFDEETGQSAGVVMVSLAVDQSDAERLVFGAEHGRVWLTEQNAETSTAGGRFRTRETIFDRVDAGSE